MAEAHVREPLETYFAYEDASVQDIKACARAAGFTGTTSQSPLLTYMTFKSRLRAFAREAGRAGPGGREGTGSDRKPSGRCMSPTWYPLRTTTSASSRSMTVTWRSTSRTLQRRSRRLSIPSFHTSRARRQPRSERTPGRSISGLWTTTIRRSGFTAPIPAYRCWTSEPCWPIARHTQPPLDRTRCHMVTHGDPPRGRRWSRSRPPMGRRR